jgi:hypothetical protein
MAVSYVNSTTDGGASGTAITCTAPAGMAAGDIVVAVFANNNAVTVSDNNGAYPFTQALGRRGINTDSGGYCVWYRVAGASEPATYAFTGNASDRWSIICSAYRGGDTSAIWDVAPAAGTENETGAGSRNHVSLALTTLTDNAMIITCGWCDSASFTFTGTPADSFNARQNNPGEQLIALADKLLASAGTQAAVTWQLNDYFPCTVQIFSIKAAAGGWANITKVNGIASASITKVNGIAVASITKVNGIAV